MLAACYITINSYRGQTFHETLDRIGEVRSILPGGLNIMALTATATKTLRYLVSRRIGMRDPYILAISPCKKNMMYSVGKFEDVSSTFKVVIERLRDKIPKIIIYGKSFGMCADIYLYFRERLGNSITEPNLGAPNLARFRLVDVFTSVTDQHQKNGIINAFTTNSRLRIVIATVPFGMGIDCLDVRQIVHIGLPDDNRILTFKRVVVPVEMDSLHLQFY